MRYDDPNNDKITFRATAMTSSGDEIPNVSFSWSTSDHTVASLNPTTGTSTRARGINPGNVTVTASAQGVSGTAELEVYRPAPPPPPPKITVTGAVYEKRYGRKDSNGRNYDYRITTRYYWDFCGPCEEGDNQCLNRLSNNRYCNCSGPTWNRGFDFRKETIVTTDASHVEFTFHRTGDISKRKNIPASFSGGNGRTVHYDPYFAAGERTATYRIFVLTAGATVRACVGNSCDEATRPSGDVFTRVTTVKCYEWVGTSEVNISNCTITPSCPGD